MVNKHGCVSMGIGVCKPAECEGGRKGVINKPGCVSMGMGVSVSQLSRRVGGIDE